jgi:hypothetical protein
VINMELDIETGIVLLAVLRADLSKLEAAKKTLALLPEALSVETRAGLDSAITTYEMLVKRSANALDIARRRQSVAEKIKANADPV